MGMFHFPSDFYWGAATAAFQVEGATHEDGRKDSIWDTFCRESGRIHNMENADIADDHYHRYQEDIDLMKRIGFNAYRLSIAWPRILPDGTGAVNPKGIDHYRKVFDALHEAGITPFVTLYHWDLPQALQSKGGWTNRETAYAFQRYAEVCFKAFGDQVEHWVTVNEPMCASIVSYWQGRHAPGRFHDMEGTCRAIHHLNLAHGLAVKSFRESGLKGEIGIVINTKYAVPETDSSEDKHAVEIFKALNTDVFTHPMFRGEYPAIATKEFGMRFPIQEGDMDIIHQRLDFAGSNYYYEMMVRHSDEAMFRYEFAPRWQKHSTKDGPIVPEGLVHTLELFHKETNGIPLYITEIGLSADDQVTPTGHVYDMDRVDYYQEHLLKCQQLIDKGFPLKGIFCWSLLDNFEWAFGYSIRFGIIYVDFKDKQKRIPKSSAWYLRDVIHGRV